MKKGSKLKRDLLQARKTRQVTWRCCQTFETEDSLSIAIDDGPIGRFATRIPVAHWTYPDVPEEATLLDLEVVAMNSNEDEGTSESTDSNSI